MIYRKKISHDVLHVALILVFMRMGPDILLSNPMHDSLVTNDIFVGPAVAYQQYDSRDSLMGSSRYATLKNMDSHFVDDSTILRDRLNYFSYRYRQNVIAYYSDRPDVHKKQEEKGIINENSDSSVDGQVLNSDDSTDFSDSSAEQTFHPVNIDLSREDMDLIEILWKQDIDLGISREAFSFFDAQDTDKTKTKAELSGCSEDFHIKENEIIESKNDCNEDISFYNEFEGLCFTIDSETGEHTIKKEIQNEAAVSIKDLEELSSPNLVTSQRNKDEKLAETFIEVRQLEQPFQVTFSPNSECVFEDEAEKFDGFVQNSEEFSQIGEEMYPSLEEYWQDISNTLPLSITGIASYQPNFSRTNRVFSDASESYADNQMPYFSSESIQHSALVSDGCVEALFHNASLTHRSQDMNNNFSYMNAASLDSTSLGCAVASSIATLTNDSEPVPDVYNNLNSTYGLDFVSIFHTNNTSTAYPNDSLISEILFEEELQLIPEEGAVGESVPKTFNEDLDNDSINSAASGNTSSFSDFKCASIKKCANLAGKEHRKKESNCTSSKYSYDHSSMSASYINADGSFQNSNLDLTSPSNNRCNYSYYLQHNHSYHLSFLDGKKLAKQVTRDKYQNSRSDEEHSRDEKRAKALKIPISIDEIINLAIDEFNERLSKFELTEPQLTLIRDIRRRGKNKVAAQNCRKRKMDQICHLQQDLDFLQAERIKLENERTNLLHQRQNIHDKYSHLCHLVFQNPSHSSFGQDVPYSDKSDTTTNFKTCDHESEFVLQGVRTKRKFYKKKI